MGTRRRSASDRFDAGRATLSDVLLANEPAVRLAAFLGVFVVMALAEALAPRRLRDHGRSARWPGNLGIVVVDTVVVRILFPTAAVGMAMLAEARGWGLFNLVGLPGPVAGLLSVLLLDLAVYGQHVLFHTVPPLWRLHRMHHADLDLDVTSGLRFHPLEIVLSMVIKIAVVVALGAPAAAVLVFEVLLNATAMFSHSNLRLPATLDRWVRLILVTPDMHRVHHSVVRAETDSNFGFNLAVWDRIFGTYRAEPAAGHDGMTIGLPVFRDAGDLRLDRMLLQPFRAGVPASTPERTGGAAAEMAEFGRDVRDGEATP